MQDWYSGFAWINAVIKTCLSERPAAFQRAHRWAEPSLKFTGCPIITWMWFNSSLNPTCLCARTIIDILAVWSCCVTNLMPNNSFRNIFIFVDTSSHLDILHPQKNTNVRFTIMIVDDSLFIISLFKRVALMIWYINFFLPHEIKTSWMEIIFICLSSKQPVKTNL